MSTSLFYTIAAQRGWSEATQIALLLEYIDRQQSEAAFEDYLHEIAEEEAFASIEE